VVGHLPNKDVMKLMRESDFLVLPTFHDTFGYVTLEAMARGTPVIGTDTCALPEIIEDGLNGILLPFDNDILGRWRWLYKAQSDEYSAAYLRECINLGKTLISKLIEVWEAPRHYKAMSADALMTVDTKFNQQHARDRLEVLYEQAMQFGAAGDL
jgi:glycosyltransferase involved in cell wall biosynthesis